MNVAQPVSERLLEMLARNKGRAVHVNELLGLGNRPRIAKALSRLVTKGEIRRLGKGFYEYPRQSALLGGPALQSPDALVQAWAKKNKMRIIPTGAYAANLLGLSTQVPAKIVYCTNGKTKTVKLGPYTIRMMHRGPKTMDVQGGFFPLLLQALRYLGKKDVDEVMIKRIRTLLRPGYRKEIKAGFDYSPVWIKQVLVEILKKD